jgi:hypothetical protein
VPSLLYTLAWALALLDALGRVPLAGDAAGLAILAFLLLELPRQRRAIRLLFLGMTAAGLISVAVAAHPAALFLAAWRRGAAYAAFFYALGALRDAAESSPMVRASGRHLVAQPPGRRYAALTIGGHVFGIILSYGAIELFGTMLGDAAHPIRRRRMMMAVFRGFATMNCWSPLNIMTVVVSTAVPAARMGQLVPIAFLLATIMLAIGWWLDRGHGTEPPVPADPGGWRQHLGIVALVGIVWGIAGLVGHAFSVPLSVGITAAVPIVGLAWLIVQRQNLPTRLAGFARRIPTFRGEATVLGAGGFMGVALGAVLPHGGIAATLALLPPIIIPLSVPVLLVATGLIGLNPIVVVAIIGAAIPNPTALGVAPDALAFACMLGWGVGVGMTAMSASAITTARWTQSDPWTVTMRWNRAYTACVLAVALAAIAAAQIILG